MSRTRSFLQRALGQRIEGPQPLTSTLLLSWLAGEPVEAGVTVNATTALGVPAFWRGCNVLAGTVAGLEMGAFDKSGKRKADADELLMRQPHPFFTDVEWKALLMWMRILHGDFYAFKLRTMGSGRRVTGLFPLDPRNVTPKLVIPKGDRLPTEKVFEVQFKDQDGHEIDKVALTEQEIFHVPGPGYNGLNGLSIIQMLKQTIGIAIASDRFAAKFFGSGTLTSGFLHTDKKLKPEDARALKERWQERVAGMNNSHEVAVLDAGAKFESLTIPPDQAQFLESRQFNVIELARVIGVEPRLLYASVGKNVGTATEQENIAFIRFSLMYHLRTIEGRWSKELLPRGTSARFLTNELTAGDTRARWSSYSIARQALAMSINEIRRAEGLPEIEDENANDPLWPGPTPPANQVGGNDGNEPPPDTGGDADGGTGDGTEEPNEE